MGNDCYYSEVSLVSGVDFPEELLDAEKTFLFRGLKDAEWELKTSIDLFLEHFSESDKSTVELALIEEFQRRYCNYAQNSPNINNRIAWWALMQHYGAPHPPT